MATIASFVLGIFILVSGCGAEGLPARTVHGEDQGPLSASKSKIRGSFPAPPGHKDDWVGTFGSFVLCVKGGGEVVIDDARIDTPSEPLSVAYFLRRVAKNNGELVPMIGAYGSPPNFEEPYAEPLGGKFSKLQRQVVDRECDANPRDGFDEMMIALRTGPEGVRMDHEYIDYQYKGRRYTLKLDAQLALCGKGDLVSSLC